MSVSLEFKPIRINCSNLENLHKSMESVDRSPPGKALQTDIAIIVAFQAEGILENYGVPVSRRAGASANLLIPKMATNYEISRNSRGWSLTGVERLDPKHSFVRGIEVAITQDQADIITKNALKGLIIKDREENT